MEVESVLVTDGLSYYGRAAIATALSLKLVIFATVKDEEEIQLLSEIFPGLNKKNIVKHGIDLDVELGLLTNGSYFDVIINNEEEENFQVSARCMNPFGKIFHFGKKDMKKNHSLGKKRRWWFTNITVPRSG